MILRKSPSPSCRLSCFCPEETTALLRCPERGFYSILRFKAEDDARQPGEFPLHAHDTLILVEINLGGYAGGELSSQALQGISSLFSTLRPVGCGLILRFLYDWDGRNMTAEPKQINTILRHMEQLGPLVRHNADRIFLTQGLFIGNWGEMHGSRYLRTDHLKRLYAAFSDAVGSGVWLSVRTPALWRGVTGRTVGPGAEGIVRDPASVPGLFNDGMFGSVSDYGTYGEHPSQRENELLFQDRLCRYVPNGGEVVGLAPQSDAERAMRDMARMHISYLNREYDARTLAKWKSAAVNDGSLWTGRNYFDYAEAHLGYRFVVRSADLRLAPLSGSLSAQIAVENVGFAPIYHETAGELVFRRFGAETVFPLSGSVKSLLQGGSPGLLTAELPTLSRQLAEGQYDIFFRLRSLKYGVTIPTANQGCNDSGCPIGRCFVK